MLDKVCGVTDDAGYKYSSLRQLHVFKYLPLVLVTGIGGFCRKAPTLTLKIRSTMSVRCMRYVVEMRAVVTAPAHMKAHPVRR